MSAAEIADNKWELDSTKPPIKSVGAIGQISLIAGLLEPTQGEVTVLGTELTRLSGRRLVNFRGANIGFVFQQYNLLPSLSGAENAAVPLLIAGRPRRQAVAKANELLAAVGMAERAHALPAPASVPRAVDQHERCHRVCPPC